MANKKQCFIIMPFGKEDTEDFENNSNIYNNLIKPVIKKCGYKPIRADELEYPGYITKDIIELVHDSDLVIADLSGKNANVYYELGIRHTLYRCGTIPLCRIGEELPFDIQNYRILFYTMDIDQEAFQMNLENRIKAFEKIKKNKFDNPVHDILQNRIKPQNPKENKQRKVRYFTLFTIFAVLFTFLLTLSLYVNKKNMLNYKNTIINKLIKKNQESYKHELNQWEKFKKTLNPKDSSQVFMYLKNKFATYPEEIKQLDKYYNNKDNDRFRSESKILNPSEVQFMVRNKHFYCSEIEIKQWKIINLNDKQPWKSGLEILNDSIAYDFKRNLMWKRFVSDNKKKYNDVKDYINWINSKKYAGFDDWRLPTLEEAMSLLIKPSKKESNYFNNTIFDLANKKIWTSDTYKKKELISNLYIKFLTYFIACEEDYNCWIVDFQRGHCNIMLRDSLCHVLTVRYGFYDIPNY